MCHRLGTAHQKEPKLKRLSTLLSLLLAGGVAAAAPGPMKKELASKHLKFAVQSQQRDGQWSFTISPKGLLASNEVIECKIEGPMTAAEIGDLDQDGWPEILVTWSSGVDRENAAVYSVNAGKSLSAVSFPSEQNSGLGSFHMQTGRLLFTDTSTMQKQFRLTNGEASKKLVAEPGWQSTLEFGFPRGFSTKKMDLTVDPRRDFLNYSSGTWYKRTKQPADMPQYNGMSIVTKVINSQVLNVLEDAKNRSLNAKKGSPLQQVGDLYASGLNEAQLLQLGATPIKGQLEKAASIDSSKKVSDLTLQWNAILGEPIFYAILVTTDREDRSRYAVYLADSGVGLAEDNYTSPKMENLRKAYLTKLESLLTESGTSPQEARQQAKTFFDLEKRLAAKRLSPTQRRDATKSFRKMRYDEVLTKFPHLHVDDQLRQLKIPTPESIWVLAPDSVAERNAVLGEGDWKALSTYMRVLLLSKTSAYLGPRFEAINTQFARALYGQIENPKRSDRAAYAVTKNLGHPVSQLYVAKYFPAQRRKAVDDMLGRVRHEFRVRLEKNNWLQESTRKQALEKLDAVDIAVAYPDQWIDFSPVDIRRDDYIGNIFRLNQFGYERDFSRYGKSVVRDRFAVVGSTLPININAAYISDSNSIDIPAAILQPPFYDPEQDMAVNFGTLGATIGHELTHGFDSGGRQFDAKGNVRDWWTAVDSKRFLQENQKLIEQANAFEYLPKEFLNGPLQTGENMADVGGLALAYAALQTWLKEHPQERKLRDGLTPEQRFFLAWSQLWAEKSTAGLQRQLNITDSHPPGRYRQTAPAQHQDEFYKAFQIRAGDPLWLDEKKRVHSW